MFLSETVITISLVPCMKETEAVVLTRVARYPSVTLRNCMVPFWNDTTAY